MHSNNGSREYNILPLIKDQEESWTDTYALQSNQFTSAQRSYDRTMGIVGEGLTACQSWLAQAKTDREAYYLDLAMNPDKYPAEAATAPTEPVTAETTQPAA